MLLLPARRRAQGLVVIGVCLSVCLCALSSAQVCVPLGHSSLYLLLSLPPQGGHVFIGVSLFVCLFVSRIMQKQLNRCSQNLVERRLTDHGRPLDVGGNPYNVTFRLASKYCYTATVRWCHRAQRGLRGCKNGPAPFPGRMSYKATKPGSVTSVS